MELEQISLSLSIIGYKIIDLLTLFNNEEDRNKSNDMIDFQKYPSLNKNDIQGHWKEWGFTIVKYGYKFFEKDIVKIHNSLNYYSAPFYQRIMMHIIGIINGQLDFNDNMYLEDVNKTIECIKAVNDTRDLYE